jgi:SAM-dependent methyltransferase
MCLSKSFHSDRSQVLAGIINRHIKELGVRTFLDIGAGDGQVAITVLSQISRYLAIEQDPLECDLLRLAALDVINARFPVEVNEQFDLVLSSYSMPEDLQLYEPFLAQAWKLVAPSGRLLIITSKRPESSIIQLSEKLLDRKYKADRRHAAITNILNAYGSVAIADERSHVQTADFSDIAEIFGSYFWSTSEQELENKPQLQELMETTFKHEGRYRVAMPHWVIAVTKEGPGGR